MEDATEWFHIQEALSPPLRNDLCGTIFERNIRGPTTLFVQWISSEDAEVELQNVVFSNYSLPVIY